MKRIILLTFLLSSSIIFSQNTTNIDVTIDSSAPVCNTNDCINLNANYFESRATTNYNVASIPYNFESSFLGTQLNLLDDSYLNINLPFNFSFYGINYSSVDIGANGLISFDSHIQNSTGTCFWSFTSTIPNNGFPIKNAIYGVYQDLNPEINLSGTAVNYITIGSAPNRKFILTFQNMYLYFCNTSLGPQTSQIILYETSNIIDVNVFRREPCTTWNNGNGVIGIQNANGTNGIAATGRNTGNWSATNESWRFSPAGSITSSVSWTKNGVSIGTQNPINVCFLGDIGNELFSVTVTYQNNNGTTTIVSSDLISPLIPVPSIQTPNNIVLCNQNTFPFSADLNQNTPVLLQNISTSDYNVSYHTSLFDAQNLINPIINPANYSFSQNQTIYAAIESLIYGCIYTKEFQIEGYQSIQAPTGSSPQSYITGQTLQNLAVNGTNILWYDSSVGGNLLPNSTLLQNNTTYYASQSNSSGCQSKTTTTSRLAITTINSLNSNEFDTNLFSVYPNPTKSIITISSLEKITNIELYNTIGQQILNKQTDSKEVLISLSDLSDGIYFFKINSNDKIKTVKIIKIN